MNKLSLTIILLTAVSLTAIAQVNTTISYQGELTTSNVTADGLHDFSFTLFDASENGMQIGNTLFINDVAVSQGIFTVELDFGPGAFAGDNLWLEVAVQASSSMEPLEQLEPRQAIHAAPYALHAEMVALDAVGGNEILNGSITGEDIALSSIQSTHIQDGAGSGLNADLLDGMDSQDFAQQAVIDNLNNTITTLQQQLNTLNDRLVNGPEIMGRSAHISNGKFEYFGESGTQAANAMCQDTFSNQAGVHMCTTHEVQRAMASKRFPSDTSSINNVIFWTDHHTFDSSASINDDDSVHGHCYGLLENAGNVATGTTMTLRFNQASPGYGGGLLGDYFHLTRNVQCGNNYPVLCCL